MRTNIEIDDALMAQAMEASTATTKKDVVEEGLRLLVRLKAQEGIRKWRGKLQWEGDLATSRQSRFPDWEKKPEGQPRDLSRPLDLAEAPPQIDREDAPAW
jgi:Arc/MetJ family transcription regulator